MLISNHTAMKKQDIYAEKLHCTNSKMYLFLQVHALVDIACVLFNLETGFINLGDNCQLGNSCQYRNLISISNICVLVFWLIQSNVTLLVLSKKQLLCTHSVYWLPLWSFSSSSPSDRLTNTLSPQQQHTPERELCLPKWDGSCSHHHPPSVLVQGWTRSQSNTIRSCLM